MTTQARLHLHVYAPALTTDDGRPLAAVEGMERALPGLRLAWRVSESGGSSRFLTARRGWRSRLQSASSACCATGTRDTR